jgi:hypothetical protein
VNGSFNGLVDIEQFTKWPIYFLLEKFFSRQFFVDLMALDEMTSCPSVRLVGFCLADVRTMSKCLQFTNALA